MDRPDRFAHRGPGRRDAGATDRIVGRAGAGRGGALVRAAGRRHRLDARADRGRAAPRAGDRRGPASGRTARGDLAGSRSAPGSALSAHRAAAPIRRDRHAPVRMDRRAAGRSGPTRALPAALERTRTPDPPGSTDGGRAGRPLRHRRRPGPAPAAPGNRSDLSGAVRRTAIGRLLPALAGRRRSRADPPAGAGSMSERTDLSAILTRALLAAAATRAAKERTGSPDPSMVSEQAHRLLADLITLLLLELEGLVETPLKSRTRIRLGARPNSRILADWPEPPREAPAADLFSTGSVPPPLPIASGPEAFFQKLLDSARRTASFLWLDPPAIEELIRWLLPVIGRCAPEDDPVGWIHAHAQRHHLVMGQGSRLRFQVDRARGRSHGVLYTPPPLTEALVEAVLYTWRELEAGENGTLFGARGAAVGPPKRILDPSCGSGQFLLSIARHLLDERTGTPEEILAIFQGMHGVDIDPGAATLAAFNLSLQSVRALSGTQGTDAPTVVRWMEERLGPGFPWFLGGQIHQGNALFLATTEEGTTFRWTDRFAEIFADDRPGFDLVIGNPPWVSYGLRNRSGPEEEESAYLRRLYTFGAQYKLSLYPLFIELALRLTRPGGLHGFLVPDSFFTGRHFSRIREHLLETCHPLQFCLVEAGPWPGVHVGHTAFYCVRRRPAPGEHRKVRTCVVQIPPAGQRRRKPPSGGTPLFFGGVHGTAPVVVDAEVLQTTPHKSFRIYRTEGERRFVEQMERSRRRLDDLIDTYSGLIARHGQESVTGPPEETFVLRDRSGVTQYRDPNPARSWKPALHSGAEVEPFLVRWKGGRLYVPDDPERLRTVYKSGFDLRRYVQSKILLRQTGDRLIAARDTTGFFCLNNVHILNSGEQPEVDLRFVCGLLMSEPIQSYYQAVALETGRPLAQVDLATLRTLPYPSDRRGDPYGRVIAPADRDARAAEAEELVDPALQRGEPEPIFRAMRAARAAGDTDRITAAVARVVEILEEEAPEIDGDGAKRALDGAMRALFGMDENGRSP
ncbi:MAG: N-6 DNA methylase [Candidatus Eisenbacteria bacterium]|nr:N-6 DNA methylase [Candidatus Latescibacterota bacterium]MBD3303260.1 N-6 DNA methylase [Candidatus Eisenbacteria bacterium]